MRRTAGVSLIELVVACLLSVAIAASITTALAVTVHHQANFTRPRDELNKSNQFQDQVTSLLTRAYYSSGNVSCYFTGDNAGGATSYSDELNFSVLPTRIRGDIVNSSDTDFTQRNTDFGPVGGLSEARLSTTPIGDAGGLTGLFYRHQTPVDTDHQNGGMESLVSADVTNVSFEFWDGTEWQATWDTATTPRLPDSVRVHYYLTSDTKQERTFVVMLPNAIGQDALQNAGTVQPSGTNP